MEKSEENKKHNMVLIKGCVSTWQCTDCSYIDCWHNPSQDGDINDPSNREDDECPHYCCSCLEDGYGCCGCNCG